MIRLQHMYRMLCSEEERIYEQEPYYMAYEKRYRIVYTSSSFCSMVFISH